jgi:hypothetical protein
MGSGLPNRNRKIQQKIWVHCPPSIFFGSAPEVAFFLGERPAVAKNLGADRRGAAAGLGLPAGFTNYGFTPPSRSDSPSHAAVIALACQSRISCTRTTWAHHVCKERKLDTIRMVYTQEYADIGITIEYAERAAEFYKHYGLDIATDIFSITIDATKVAERYVYVESQGTGGYLVGGDILEAAKAPFTSFVAAKEHIDSKPPAAYVNVMLVCPLLSAAASAFRVIGVLPTNLKYTSDQLVSWLNAALGYLYQVGFRRVVLVGADGDARHRRAALDLLAVNAPQHWPLRAAVRLGQGLSFLSMFAPMCLTTQFYLTMTSDATHLLKKIYLMPLSMSRTLVMGHYAVLASHFIVAQMFHKESGLLARDVNGADKMNYKSAERKANFAVRKAFREMGHFGTAVYCWVGALIKAAMFDRKLPILVRFEYFCKAVIFIRYWHAWMKASKMSCACFISAQLHIDMLLAFSSFVHRMLMHRDFFPDLPFCIWLDGSDQQERFFSEARGFVRGMADFDVVQLLSVIKRFHAMYRYLSLPNVRSVLPAVITKMGYNRSLYEHASNPPCQSYPTDAELEATYLKCVAEIKPFVEELGMRPALENVGDWELPPLENFSILQQDAAIEVEEDIDSHPGIDMDQLEKAYDQFDPSAVDFAAAEEDACDDDK